MNDQAVLDKTRAWRDATEAAQAARHELAVEVRAAWTAGASIAHLARLCDVQRNTIYMWVHTA